MILLACAIINITNGEHKNYEDLMTSPTCEIHNYIKMLNDKGLDITDPVVIEIEELTTNIGTGCYEVTYWATGII